MDTFEVSKIAGAVLSALLIIVGFRTVLEISGKSRAHCVSILENRGR